MRHCCRLQVLFSAEGGYTYLDVRPALEFEEIGKVKVRQQLQVKAVVE